jgi:SRSO17 transposase
MAGRRSRTEPLLLFTLPADAPFERMVDQAKLRWRIERDYLELKQGIGFGYHEGRG